MTLRWQHSTRFLSAVALTVLGICASCRGVYDPELLESGQAGVGVDVAGMMGVDGTCGDGMVTGSEKCDIGIAGGAAGACPASCPELAPCVFRDLVGSACQTECVVRPEVCQNDDGCCPGACSTATDNDCSVDCGNMIVEPMKGETCEPMSAAGCPTSCDDSNPCTVDMLMGDAANCNARCVMQQIMIVDNADGCCPAGVPGSETDTDCEMTMMMGDDVQQCDAASPNMDACDKCACMGCTSVHLACLDSGDAAKDSACKALLKCSRDNNCRGADCYDCADMDCTMVMGPCVSEVEAAAESMDIMDVANRTTDPAFALGRATAAGDCAESACPAECPQSPPPPMM